MAEVAGPPADETPVRPASPLSNDFPRPHSRPHVGSHSELPVRRVEAPGARLLPSDGVRVQPQGDSNVAISHTTEKYPSPTNPYSLGLTLQGN